MDINCNNFQKICRICLSDKCLKPIANIALDGGVNVTEILIDFMSPEDLYNAKLPQNMCLLCVNQLDLYHNFKKICSKNQSLLKTLLKNESKGIKDCELFIKKDDTEENYILPSENADSDSTNSDDDMPLICRVETPQEKNVKPCLRKKPTKKSKSIKSFQKKKDVRKSNELINNAFDLDGAKNYTCKQCNKSFTFKYKLAMHMRVHTKEKPFKCDICHITFSLNGNLKRHKMIHTGEKPHVCKICGKGFIQTTSLQMHSQKHHKENMQQKFTCKTCCRIFVRAAPYNLHIKKHHPTELDEQILEESKEVKIQNQNLEYKCDICGREFSKLILLKRHTSRHGEKKFLCSDCGKGFVRKADLQSHFKVHTGEKPHTCSICNKSFAHTGSLVTHALVHSGYKPYNCSLCSKSFSQLSHLKVHKRTHSGERPYSCSFCEKTFALKSNLTVHIRTHTGETPYLCTICGKGYYDSSSMKKHKLSHLNTLGDSSTRKLCESTS